MSTLRAPDAIPEMLRWGNDELEVEIGTGNGHFLCEYARRHRQRLLIGVERKKQRATRALKKVNDAELDNVQIVLGSAEHVMRELPSGAVSAFHIYFPDPWPKSRHRKRRFLRAEMVGCLLDRLRPGGRVYLITDMLDYCAQAKVLFALHGALPFSPAIPPEETHLSVYSRRFHDAARPVYFAVAVRPGDLQHQTQDDEHDEEVHSDVGEDQQA